MYSETMQNGAPFKTIKDACLCSGVSQYAIRKGCKEGTIPHIRIGKKYLINMPMFIEKLNSETSNIFGGDNC